MEDEREKDAPPAVPPTEREPGEAGGSQPSEEELRAQLEEEVRKLRVEEVVLQSAASIVNLTARRIAKEDERDLEQGRIGIEAVRALLPLLPAEVQPQLRNALSELQVLYAREAGGSGAKEAGEGEAASKPAQGPPLGGTRRPPPKLWTPPGSA